MADPIVVTAIIGAVTGILGLGLSGYNLYKSFVKKPVPLFIEPTIIDTTPKVKAPGSMYTLNMYFELRNNGDRVSRLYYYSIMQLFDKDDKKIDEDIRQQDDKKKPKVEMPDLPPHSINYKGYPHYFKLSSEKNTYGILYFKGHYFNHRNKKKIHLQKFIFKKKGQVFDVKEIKIKKKDFMEELKQLPI